MLTLVIAITAIVHVLVVSVNHRWDEYSAEIYKLPLVTFAMQKVLSVLLSVADNFMNTVMPMQLKKK